MHAHYFLQRNSNSGKKCLGDTKAVIVVDIRRVVVIAVSYFAIVGVVVPTAATQQALVSSIITFLM